MRESIFISILVTLFKYLKFIVRHFKVSCFVLFEHAELCNVSNCFYYYCYYTFFIFWKVSTKVRDLPPLILYTEIDMYSFYNSMSCFAGTNSVGRIGG